MTEKNNHRPFDEDNYTHNIDRNVERSLDRRGFMKTLVGSAGLFAAATLPWGAVAAKEIMGLGKQDSNRQKIVDLEDLAVGDAVDFKYPTKHDGAIMIRLSEEKLVAYLSGCTHLQCPVFWEKDSGKMICPCHNGIFDAETGDAIAGPPRRALPTIELEIEDGVVYAVRVKPYD